MTRTRRKVLQAATALFGSTLVPRLGSAQSRKSRLIVLGTGGGPRPRKSNSAPAQVIVVNEGRIPLQPLIHVHELTDSGLVLEDENIKVRATLVDHPPVVPSFGYRFDCPDRSIVISGDTRPSENLIKLAHGADVLVHDALYPPAIDRLVAGVPNASSLKKSILSHHTSAEDAGRVAKAAGVKTLVLSHLVPPDDPEVTDQMWMDAAKRHFDGRIIVGKDLLEI